LAHEHELRGYDAVHLAAMLTLGTRETVLATADDAPCLAATSNALAVARL
jgi:hypothetical protein